MSSKERLLTAMRCEEPDTVPVSPRAASRIPYGCRCWMHTLKAAKEFDFDPIILHYDSSHPILYYTWHSDRIPLNGVEVDLKEKKFSDHVVVSRRIRTPEGELTDKTKYGLYGANKLEHLIKGSEDLKKMKYLLPHSLGHLSRDFHEMIRRIGDAGVVGVVVNGPLDRWAVDVYKLMVAYHRNKGYAVDLLDLFHEQIMKECEGYLEEGAQVIYASWWWEGLNVGWSPKMYRELFAPLIRKQADLIHRYDGICHFNYGGSKCMDAIPILNECRIDVLETLEPPPYGDADLAQIKKKIGDRICLRGNINNWDILHEGTPECVDKVVKEAIEIAAPGGGYILGTSGNIRPGTPLQNVKTFYEAGRKYGQYT